VDENFELSPLLEGKWLDHTMRLRIAPERLVR
jgi:hypothetical protein